ncbi:MAG: aspartate 1-decarboxylase [Moorea sp. SIO2I5]|nr:aspartate 1-decarboxylase [Moorena sp. SIO2I5]
MKIVLSSKIHRAWVTDANPDYIGSILIDEDLMDKVGIWNYEKVLICDVTNGNRFETYAIAGDRGSGVCSIQGAAARLSNKGNCIIIMSFKLSSEPIDPKMILVDEKNQFVEYLGVEKNVQPVH